MKILVTTDTHCGLNHGTQKIHIKFLKELATIEWDVLVHSGDWAVNKQRQLYRSMKMFREMAGNRPIITVRGNHDFWQYEFNDRHHSPIWYNEMMENHRKWFQELNITHLDGTSVEVNGVQFVGMDGWYGHYNPPTNDTNWMWKNLETGTMHQFLSRKAYKDFDKVLEAIKPGAVFVTHFPLYAFDYEDEQFSGNPKWLEHLSGKANVCIFGHSHKPIDTVMHGMRILNVGSDYNKPKFVIVEV